MRGKRLLVQRDSLADTGRTKRVGKEEGIRWGIKPGETIVVHWVHNWVDGYSGKTTRMTGTDTATTRTSSGRPVRQ